MNSIIIGNIIRFVGLLLLQVIVLNEIELHGFVNPYVYPLFILLLPFETPTWLLLILAFGMGISVDIFSNTLGFHAAACVFMAFFRPLVIELNKPRNGYELGTKPNSNSMGFRWFFVYASLLIILHHLCYFFIEIFSFTQLIHTLMLTSISIVISILLILVVEYLFRRFS